MLLKTIHNQPNVPILYNTNLNKLDVIYDKLYGFLNLTEQEKKTIEDTKLYLNNKRTLDVLSWSQLVDVLLEKLSSDQWFPLLDIFKSLLLHQEVSQFYTKNRTCFFSLTIKKGGLIFWIASQLGKILELATKNEASLGRATWIMILRVACNLFSDSTLSTTYFTSHLEGATYRTILTQLLITSLLSQDSQIRQAAASLAYNCSTNVSIERLKKEEGTWTGMTEQEDDDWQVELLSAVVDALTKEKDEEICKFCYNRDTLYWHDFYVVHRLLATIGKLLFLLPETSSISNLLSALDFSNIIDTKKKEGVIKSSQLIGLSSDICKLIE